MVADIRALLGKVADYAVYYDSEFLSSMGKVSQLVGHPRNFVSVASVGEAWLQDPILALASARWYSCTRQDTSERYWRLAAQAITDTITQASLYERNQPQEARKQLEHLYQQPADCFENVGQRQSSVSLASKRPVVKDLTRLHLNHKNIMWNLRSELTNNTKQAHFAIRANIRGMGDKTTAFLLRDVAWVYELEGQGSLIHTSQAIYIQPIDIWVRRLAECLWPDSKGKRDWKVVARHIVAECKQAEVSPIRFNQGAWYLGTRIAKTASQLCSELVALNA